MHLSFAILVALLWAIANICIKTATQNTPSNVIYVIYSFALFIGILIYSAFAYKDLAPHFGAITTKTLLLITIAVILNPIIATLLYFHLLEKYPATKVMPLAYTVPLFSAILAVILLKEKIDTKTLAGTLLIVLGGVLVLTK